MSEKFGERVGRVVTEVKLKEILDAAWEGCETWWVNAQDADATIADLYQRIKSLESAAREYLDSEITMLETSSQSDEVRAAIRKCHEKGDALREALGDDS